MDNWALYRVRDGYKVYWNGTCAWGRADTYAPNMDSKRSQARVLNDEELEYELKVWPQLKKLDMEPA